jgi:hypothetical protein
MSEQLYDYSIDYTDKIKKAEEDGNYLLAAEFEKIRNQKIDDQKLDYAKTYKYQNRVNEPSPSYSLCVCEGPP